MLCRRSWIFLARERFVCDGNVLGGSMAFNVARRLYVVYDDIADNPGSFVHEFAHIAM